MECLELSGGGSVQFGCCISGHAQAKSQDEALSSLIGQLKALQESGYDFAELSVSGLMNFTDDTFDRLVTYLADASFPTRAANNFIPGSIRLTGEHIDSKKAYDYVDAAMARLKRLGVGTIVFGSSGARNIPEGFSRDTALRQLDDFLLICNTLATQHDVIVAVEPLNRRESNVFQMVGEVFDHVSSLHLDHVRVLADWYHMYVEGEGTEAIVRADRQIAHVHIANHDRFRPGIEARDDEEFLDLFRTLQAIEYPGLISVECRFTDFDREIRETLSYVKDTWEQANIGADGEL